MLLIPLVRSIHRNDKLYDDADTFKPERFLDTAPGIYSLIAFGGGPHRCLGHRLAIFEATLMLQTILRTADLDVVDSSDEKIKRVAGSLIPENGALVRARAIGHEDCRRASA